MSSLKRKIDQRIKQWSVDGKFTFRGLAFVEAITVEEATKRFEEGCFEFYQSGAELSDWERYGKPRLNE